MAVGTWLVRVTPTQADNTKGALSRPPAMRFTAGMALGIVGPGGALQDTLSSIPDTRRGGDPLSTLSTFAAEVRVPGTRRLWVRAQRTRGMIGHALVHDLHPGLLESNSSSITAWAGSLGLLGVYDGGWWRGGLGLARNELGFGPGFTAENAERHAGMLADLRVRALGRHRSSRLNTYLEFGGQYNATSRLEIPLGLVGNGVEQRAGRFSFSHGTVRAEIGLEF
jgi:hypothetical protein